MVKSQKKSRIGRDTGRRRTSPSSPVTDRVVSVTTIHTDKSKQLTHRLSAFYAVGPLMCAFGDSDTQSPDSVAVLGDIVMDFMFELVSKTTPDA